MTTLETPLDQLARALDVITYQKAIKPKNVKDTPHPFVGHLNSTDAATSQEIEGLSKDPEQLWQYLTGLQRVIPWYAASAFATSWEGEATANGISLANHVIRAIAPLPEALFFHMMALLYRPKDEGGLDFQTASSERQTADELDGDWFNTISAYVRDMIRYRGLGQDGRAHAAGTKLHSLGLALLRLKQPRRKTFSDQQVVDAVDNLLLGEEKLEYYISPGRLQRAA